MNTLFEWLLGTGSNFFAQEGALSVQFKPRWPWQDYVGVATWNVVLLAVLVFVSIWIYRREAVSGKKRWLLVWLRIGLLAAVILMLNRPELTLTRMIKEASVVAVLVDDSASMSVADVSARELGVDASSQSGLEQGRLSRISAAERVLFGPGGVTRPATDAGESLRAALMPDHEVRVFRFSTGLGGLIRAGDEALTGAEQQAGDEAGKTSGLQAKGVGTSIAGTVLQVLDELSGERLAGVVVISDGRETRRRSAGEVIAAADRLRAADVPLVAVAVGSESPGRNLSLGVLDVQDSAFMGDIVNVRVGVRASGYEPGTRLKVRLISETDGQPLTDASGAPAETVLVVNGQAPTGPAGDVAPASAGAISGEEAKQGAAMELVQTDIAFKPGEPGPMQVRAEVRWAGGAEAADGGALGGAVGGVGGGDSPVEMDEQDNSRVAGLRVLEAKINVLLVDGYPRWDFRYLRNELMRDATVDVSTLLLSADSDFAQDGDVPIRRFPETVEELLVYDVVVLGDVDPRQFTDAQLTLLNEFVSRRSGGLAVAAGAKYGPQVWKGTALEPLVPVELMAQMDAGNNTLTQGFRPSLTAAGSASAVFRFLPDRLANERLVAEELREVFWYATGVKHKAGSAEVFAEHPSATTADGKKVPLLVFGRYGSGRTMYLGFDDTWRWRFYRGEAVFNTFWVQALRELARSKKLGQRRASLATSAGVYELGETVELLLRVIDPQVISSDTTELVATVTVQDQAGGSTGAGVPLRVSLRRVSGGVNRDVAGGAGVGGGAGVQNQNIQFVGRFVPQGVGRYVATVELPNMVGAMGEDGSAGISTPIEVTVPRLEFADARRDDTVLLRLAEAGRQTKATDNSGGKVLQGGQDRTKTDQFLFLNQAIARVPGLIPSAARELAVESSRPLWSSPGVLLLLAGLLVAEWVIRKSASLV